MFEKLVVSTSERRTHRTARFFALTLVFYIGAFTSAVVLSVMASSPTMIVPGTPPPLIVRVASTVIDKARTGDTGSSSGRQLRAAGPVTPSTVNPLPLSLIGRGPQIPTFSGPVEGPSNGGGGNGDGVLGLGVPDSGNGSGGPSYVPPPEPKPKPPEPDKRPVRLTTNVLQGRAIEKFSPDYPKIAQQAHMQGDVSVEVIVSPEGKVESARVISGPPLFVNCALESARRWRFQPTLLNGVAVRVTGVITFVFRLNQ